MNNVPLAASSAVLEALTQPLDSEALVEAYRLNELREIAWVNEGKAMAECGPDNPRIRQITQEVQAMEIEVLRFSVHNWREWTVATWGAVDRNPQQF